jgi:hypothetical protein
MKLTLIVLGLALAGCSGGPEEGYLVRESQIPQGLAGYRSATVEVSTPDLEQYQGGETLKASLIGKLSSLGCFNTFVSGAELSRAELKIAVVVTGASNVSGAERVLLGGLAGKPRVTADVRLVDLRNGALVGRFQVEGTTVGGSPTGYTTPEAYENAGAGIAEYIQEHK